MKKALVVLLAALAVNGFAQQPKSTPKLSTEFSRLMLRHLFNRKTLQADAEKLAEKFRKQLGSVGTNVAHLESEANSRFGDTDWKQRGELLMEFWRIRSSINLLSLLSPGVFKEVTGFDPPNLQIWTSGLKSVETKLTGL